MTGSGIGRVVAVVVALFVTIQVSTSVLAIALLERMGPAVAHVLEENVSSIEAVERMLGTLAEPGEVTSSARAAYAMNLRVARANITEAEEEPAIDTLERLRPGALAGDRTAVVESVRALHSLGTINRAAVRRADGEARRLGAAGSWGGALLALVGLASALLVHRELQKRLVVPVRDLAEVVRARRSGDRHRRCRVRESGPELGEVMEEFNAMLDALTRPLQRAPSEGTSELIRAALLVAMDASADPTVVVDAHGRIIAASQVALALLAGGSGERWRAALARMDHGDVGGDAPLSAISLAGDVGWLVRLGTGSSCVGGPTS